VCVYIYNIGLTLRRPHPSAAAIGALNTLTRGADGRLHADNTDWVGIRNLLARGLAMREGGAPHKPTALVLGAGGTARAACYALRQVCVYICMSVMCI